MVVKKLICVCATAALLASGLVRADALTDFMQGKGTYVPPAALPDAKPMSGGKNDTVPRASVQPYTKENAVTADVIPLAGLSENNPAGLVGRVADEVGKDIAWHVVGDWLSDLVSGPALGILTAVLGATKDVGGTPSHGALVVPQRWGEGKVLGRPTIATGERFAVLCVSATGSNVSALASEISIESLTETVAGGSEWTTNQRISLYVTPKNIGRYLLVPHWTGTVGTAGVYRVKCQRNVFGEQIKAFEFQAIGQKAPKTFGTLDAAELIPYYFGPRYRPTGCSSRSPCVELRQGDKVIDRYHDMNIDMPLEASIHTVERVGDEAVVIFEVAGAQPWARWDYLKLVRLSGRWREAAYSSNPDQASGSAGMLSSTFAPLVVDGKIVGAIVDSSYIQMGSTTMFLSIYKEEGTLFVQILNQELADMSSPYWMSKDLSNGLPDIFLARTPDHEGARLAAQYRFDGQRYRQYDPFHLGMTEASKSFKLASGRILPLESNSPVLAGQEKSALAARREVPPVGQPQHRSMFHLISNPHDMKENLDLVCRQVAGNSYRLADWNDIRAQHLAGMAADSILASGSAFVSVSGNGFWNQGRHYIATRANHRRDPGYLAHDSIDNQLFDLGSWYPSYPVLCFKE